VKRKPFEQEAAERVAEILRLGRWPSGYELMPYERALLLKNVPGVAALAIGRTNRP
jgi:hypothetical protein